VSSSLIFVIFVGVIWLSIALVKLATRFRVPSRVELTEAQRRRVDRITDLISTHLHTLYRKKSQCLYLDDYGKVMGYDEWAKEVANFTCQVLRADPALAGLGRESETLTTSHITHLIDGLLESYVPLLAEVDVSALDGTAYEVYCADILRQCGWQVIRKGGSGDQGVDLVATLGSLRVAVQCKRYSQPVGNKAVQEVGAGRKFDKCDLGVVVSNQGYTPSARKLAGVLT